MGIHQDIRFCRTADGVQLATACYGSGPPFVRASIWLTNVERDPDSPMQQQWIREFGRDRCFVTYDERGCGLSSRHPAEISFEAWVSDLETVVDRLGLETFPLLGMSQGAPIAIAYAARHPERVTSLVLFGGFATTYFSTRNPDPRIREEAETLIKVIELGWGRGSAAFRQVFVNQFIPSATPAQQQEFDEYSLLTATAEVAAAITRVNFSINVRDEAARVKCPTLVLHSRGDQLIHFEQGQKVAGLIPGARFVPVDCANHIPLDGEACWPGVVREIRDFLGDPSAVRTERLTPRQISVLMQVAAGKTDKQIARELGLSPRTVEMHVAGAMKALSSSTRAEAVARASKDGLLSRT
jgi:pimeloyl-ACP methyl ester carboxylesterase/DNA-binding CsgD family transcriptional regulator